MTEPTRGAEFEVDDTDLQGRVARGLTWTMTDIWGRQLINLVTFVLLARLLSDTDFGLVALATVFVTFAQLFVDQGLGDALIQRRTVSKGEVDTAFWAALATGALLTVIGVAVGPLIGALVNEPELGPIIQVLSLTFTLAAFTAIQIALLRRALAFRSLAARALVATAVGGVVGVVAALQGFGAWALVAQQVAAAIASVLTLWWVSPWKPSRYVSWSDFRELFRFGSRVVGSDFLSFLSRYSDNFLIGIFLGPAALGLYAVGYRIVEVSQTILINVARKIAFPAFSRLQHDPDRMVRAYLRLTRVASAVILPGYIGLALVATELTVVIFGPQWRSSGQVAAILFLIGPVLTIQAFSDSMLNAAGHPEIVLRFRFITAVTSVIGFVLAVQFGILAVAGAFVVRGYLLMPLLLVWMRRYAGVEPRAFLLQLRGAAAATLVMAAAVLGVKLWIGSSVGDVPLLLAEIAVALPAFFVTLWLVERDLVAELLSVGGQAIPVRAAWSRERARRSARRGG